MNALDSTSTRPYLIRALYEWCTDNGFTPYVAVSVDDTVQVPREYVKNNEIVLNISFDATSSLKLGNDFIEFKARFAGSAREIMVPITHVIAIYARENGQGMAFPHGYALQRAQLLARNLGVMPVQRLLVLCRFACSRAGAFPIIRQKAPKARSCSLCRKAHPIRERWWFQILQTLPSPPRTRPSLKRVK
jgi:stringent starvation protein B